MASPSWGRRPLPATTRMWSPMAVLQQVSVFTGCGKRPQPGQHLADAQRHEPLRQALSPGSDDGHWFPHALAFVLQRLADGLLALGCGGPGGCGTDGDADVLAPVRLVAALPRNLVLLMAAVRAQLTVVVAGRGALRQVTHRPTPPRSRPRTGHGQRARSRTSPCRSRAGRRAPGRQKGGLPLPLWHPLA